MPETKAWMKFQWVQTPSRCRCSARSMNAGIQRNVSFRKPLAIRSSLWKIEIRAYPSWSRFSFFCALFEWCVVVGGRPVPGSHPSSRQRNGEVAQRSCLSSTSGRLLGRHPRSPHALYITWNYKYHPNTLVRWYNNPTPILLSQLNWLVYTDVTWAINCWYI